MVDNRLKKLSRRELLGLLIDTSRENEELKYIIERAQEAISDRRIMIENAGSMAEAVLSLNKLYEAADLAAKQYVDNIKRTNDERDKKYEEIVNLAYAEADRILTEAKEEAERIVSDAKADAERIIAGADQTYEIVESDAETLSEEAEDGYPQDPDSVDL